MLELHVELVDDAIDANGSRDETHVEDGYLINHEVVVVEAREFFVTKATYQGGGEIHRRVLVCRVRLHDLLGVSAAEFLWHTSVDMAMTARMRGRGGRTLFILLPHTLEVDFGAKSSSHHGQRAAPGKGVCHGIVLVEIVLGKARVDAFVRVDGVLNLGLQSAGAYPRGDSLLHRPLPPLDSQDLGPPHHAHGRLALAGALGKMDEDAEGGGQALSRIGYGGRIVSDQTAELARARLRLGIHLETDGGGIAKGYDRGVSAVWQMRRSTRPGATWTRNGVAAGASRGEEGAVPTIA